MGFNKKILASAADRTKKQRLMDQLYNSYFALETRISEVMETQAELDEDDWTQLDTCLPHLEELINKMEGLNEIFIRDYSKPLAVNALAEMKERKQRIERLTQANQKLTFEEVLDQILSFDELEKLMSELYPASYSNRFFRKFIYKFCHSGAAH